MEWKQVAGRGVLGSCNWGASFDAPIEKLEKQRQELLDHLGEKVLLSGGGGPGSQVVTLVGVPPIETKDGQSRLHAVLMGATFGGRDYEDRLDRKWGYVHSMPTNLLFEPALDSWQISVKVKSSRVLKGKKA